MDDVLRNLPKLANEKHTENKKFFAKLKKKPPRKNLNAPIAFPAPIAAKQQAPYSLLLMWSG